MYFFSKSYILFLVSWEDMASEKHWNYHIHKAVWPWARLKVQKGYTKVNIELWYEEYPLYLQHNTGNLWGIIPFTKQIDLGLAWKFKKGQTNINIYFM